MFTVNCIFRASFSDPPVKCLPVCLWLYSMCFCLSCLLQLIMDVEKYSLFLPSQEKSFPTPILLTPVIWNKYDYHQFFELFWIYLNCTGNHLTCAPCVWKQWHCLLTAPFKQFDNCVGALQHSVNQYFRTRK